MVRDCLELPPVPGIFKGNTKACDGPDLLELPFFYVSLHFLLCYPPPTPLPPPPIFFFFLPYSLWLSPFFSHPAVSLMPSDSVLFSPAISYLFHQAAGNILITLCSSALVSAAVEQCTLASLRRQGGEIRGCLPKE